MIIQSLDGNKNKADAAVKHSQGVFQMLALQRDKKDAQKEPFTFRAAFNKVFLS